MLIQDSLYGIEAPIHNGHLSTNLSLIYFLWGEDVPFPLGGGQSVGTPYDGNTYYCPAQEK